MDNTKLIADLEQSVRDAEELLRRRKEALAALKGKTGPARGSRKKGFRTGSIPDLAYKAIEASGNMALDDLVTQMKKSNDTLTARKVSIALSRYVRLGQHFVLADDGKYSLK